MNHLPQRMAIPLFGSQMAPRLNERHIPILVPLLLVWALIYAPPVSSKSPTWDAQGDPLIQESSVYCGQFPGDSLEETSTARLLAQDSKSLADLISIGMKSNPETRIAWANAEDAASSLGIAESRYGPIIAAQATSLYQHSAFPLPKTLEPSGYFKSDAEATIPALTLKWLLYDFGGKDAVLDEAQQTLAAANFGFSATHRKVSILITRQFFLLASDLARRDATAAALRSAQLVEQAARAKQGRGTATLPEVLQAHAAVTEAQLRVEEANALLEDAHMGLGEAVGLRPDTPLCVRVPESESDVSAQSDNLDRLVSQALARRPEVNAAIAKVKASNDAIISAKSEYYPRIALSANVGQNIGRLRSAGSDWSTVNQPIYGIGLVFEVPIYDGSIRSAGVHTAESRRAAAEAQLDATKNQVIHEVVKAYNDFQVASRRRNSSNDFLSATQKSFEATLESYRNGLATMPELESSRAALTRAQMVVRETLSDVQTARAVLAFTAGDMIDLGP